MDDTELGRILGNIEGTQQQILERLDRWGKQCCDRHDDIDDRFTEIETNASSITKKLTAVSTGIATAVAAAVAATISFFKG